MTFLKCGDDICIPIIQWIYRFMNTIGSEVELEKKMPVGVFYKKFFGAKSGVGLGGCTGLSPNYIFMTKYIVSTHLYYGLSKISNPQLYFDPFSFVWLYKLTLFLNSDMIFFQYFY